jgi:hypothetical protein
MYFSVRDPAPYGVRYPVPSLDPDYDSYPGTGLGKDTVALLI